MVNQTEIKNLRNLDIKKVNGTDLRPPKLMKLSANFLTQLLTEAMKNECYTKCFQKNVKTTSMIPLVKGKAKRTKSQILRQLVY